MHSWSVWLPFLSSVLFAGDRPPQFLFVHAAATADIEPFRPRHQLVLGVAPDVDAAGCLAATAIGRRALGRLGVRRPFVLLGLPAVAHLFKAVLQGRQRSAVGPLPFAILFDGAVMSLGVGPL